MAVAINKKHIPFPCFFSYILSYTKSTLPIKDITMLRVLIFLLFFTVPLKADEPPKPELVVLTTVQEGTLNQTITGVGTFTPYNDVILKAETSGRVEAVHFREGQSVQAHQKLFTLHNKEQEASVKKAQATLEANKQKLKRKLKLAEKKFGSAQELEVAQAQVKSDEADLVLAKEKLAKATIYAPFDGVLSARKVCKGTYVQDGDELVRLQDITPIRLIFELPQREIPLIEVGNSVKATTDVYPEKTFEGKIEAIEPSVKEATRSVTIHASFDNKEELLIPGLYGQAQVTSKQQRQTPVLLVPEQALLIRQDGAYVFKKVNDKAALTKVTVGSRTKDQAEILSGLQKGDEVVLEGQDKIKDGDRITGKAK
jgi:membrane fusion protein (multidrug efflux system)